MDDDVYGLTFAIEYEAADGAFSRRRIMLRNVSIREDGVVFLRSLCFERNALRSFRLDRVRRVIDPDGVVHEDPAAFVRDELRLTFRPRSVAKADPREEVVSPAALSRTPAHAEADALGDELGERPGMAQRRIARDGLRVLAALGRSDGLLHPAEVEVVLDYIAAACERVGQPCGPEDRAALAPYVRRQRPGVDVLEACLQRIESGDPAARSLLLDHAERLITADGLEHDAERQLLHEIRRDTLTA